MKNKRKKGWIIVLVIIGIIVLGLAFLFIIGSDEEEDDTAADLPDRSAAVKSYDEETEGNEDTDLPASSNDTWTVMVYMCGSDLESKGMAGTYNLYEMFSAQLPDNKDNINILVETGGTKEWFVKEEFDDRLPSFDGIDTKSLSYYRIEEDDMILEEKRELASMGEADTLKDFITWSAEKYPADKYMLILWDHGGGSLQGVCFDELHDDDSLTVDELKEAIAGADLPFEVVGFDACLMADLETAKALQGYCHYMIASQESEPGYGWAYTDFLEYLSDDTGISGLELGKHIADGFMAKCREYDTDEMSTLSVVDITKIPSLYAAYRNLSGEMVLSTQKSENFRSFQQGVTKAESYGGNSDSQGYANMVDLADMVKKTEGILDQNSSKVLSALKEAVCYEVHGKSRANSNGISVYYPLYYDEDEINIYNDLSDNIAFSEYISILGGDYDSAEWEKKWEEAWKDAYLAEEVKEGRYDSYFNNGQSIASDYQEEPSQEYYEALSSVKPVQKEEYDLKYKLEQGDDGYYQLKIESGREMVSDVSFMLYYSDKVDGSYAYLGSDNNLDCDYDKGIFTEAFEGTWMKIGGEYVYAELIEQNDDYNLYTIPIYLNGKEKYLKAVYDYNEEAFRILGAYDGIDEETGLSGRDVKQLKDGDEIEFIFYIMDEDSDSEDLEAVVLSKISWKSDMVMEDADMPDGYFIYIFQIKNIFGDIEYSDPVYMELSNGEIFTY